MHTYTFSRYSNIKQENERLVICCDSPIGELIWREISIQGWSLLFETEGKITD